MNVGKSADGHEVLPGRKFLTGSGRRPVVYGTEAISRPLNRPELLDDTVVEKQP
jgi:hypothetical protein